MSEELVLNPEQAARLKSVLIHQVGDDRYCPHCKYAFIPQDITAKDTWELYKEIFKNE